MSISRPPAEEPLLDRTDVTKPVRTACLLFPPLYTYGLFVIAYLLQTAPIRLAAFVALAAFLVRELYALLFDTYEHPPIRRLLNFAISVAALTAIAMLIAILVTGA